MESAESLEQKLSLLVRHEGQTFNGLGSTGSISLDGNIGCGEPGLLPFVLQNAGGLVIRLVANSEVIYSSELLFRFAFFFGTLEANGS